MKLFLGWLFRIVAVVALTVAGFLVGLVAGYKICMWWVVPGWIKAYPHDGQLGLGVMLYAVFGSMLGAILFLVIGGIAAVRFRPRRKKQDSELPEAALDSLADEPRED